jgi:opacity protein-like surface antigen
MENSTVNSVKPVSRLLVPLLVLVALAPQVLAEDVEKRWRLGGALGAWKGTDSVRSDAGNGLTLVDDNQEVTNVFIDPRNDSAVFGRLDIQPTPMGQISGQYAVSKIFVLEASVGYQKADVGDVEVQGEFRSLGQVVDTTVRPFEYATFRIPVGQLTRIPVQLVGFARFRPRSKFNPYVGGGVGYSFIGLDPSDEFNELSRNLDASRGGQARLTTSFRATPTVVSSGSSQAQDLLGASIEADDSFEWLVAGGGEFSFKRKWVAYFDLRWSFSSRNVAIGFNNDDYLGTAVPNRRDFDDSEFASPPMIYGPVTVNTGGIVDAGGIVPTPRDDAPEDSDCVANPQLCEFPFVIGATDGVLDTGDYYIQGGEFSYDGISILVGVRYTF